MDLEAGFEQRDGDTRAHETAAHDADFVNGFGCRFETRRQTRYETLTEEDVPQRLRRLRRLQFLEQARLGGER